MSSKARKILGAFLLLLAFGAILNGDWLPAIILALVGAWCFTPSKKEVQQKAEIHPATVATPPAPPKEEKPTKEYKCRVAGPYYHQKEIKSLLTVNPIWKDDESYGFKTYMFERESLSADLVPEPDNPHDSEAVRVEAYGELLGYVPQDETNLKRLIKEGRVKEAAAEVYGGPYMEDGEIHDDTVNVWLIVEYE